MENGKVLLNNRPPPLDTGNPDYHDCIVIKEVDTTNGVLYLGGGGNVIRDFWYLGKGRWRWQYIKMLHFWLIYAQYKYSLNNTVIPCVFPPFLAENYESNLMNVTLKNALLHPFGPHKNVLKPGDKSCINYSRMKSSIISYPYYTELPKYSPKKGDWNWMICPI